MGKSGKDVHTQHTYTSTKWLCWTFSAVVQSLYTLNHIILNWRRQIHKQTYQIVGNGFTKSQTMHLSSMNKSKNITEPVLILLLSISANSTNIINLTENIQAAPADQPQLVVPTCYPSPKGVWLYFGGKARRGSARSRCNTPQSLNPA